MYEIYSEGDLPKDNNVQELNDKCSNEFSVQYQKLQIL